MLDLIWAPNWLTDTIGTGEHVTVCLSELYLGLFGITQPLGILSGDLSPSGILEPQTIIHEEVGNASC